MEFVQLNIIPSTDEDMHKKIYWKLYVHLSIYMTIWLTVGIVWVGVKLHFIIQELLVQWHQSSRPLVIFDFVKLPFNVKDELSL